MITLSNSIRNALAQSTTTRKGRILVNDNYYDVYNVILIKDCYEDGNAIGNAIASQLEFDLPYMPKFDSFKYYEGIWTGEEYEYIDLGTFNVYDETDTDEFNKHIVAFDNLIKFNTLFIPPAYPITIYNLLAHICETAGVELINESIVNGDFEIKDNQFEDDDNLKTVLKAICAISGNIAIIKNDKLYLKLKEETTEEIDKSYHQIVDWKRTTYGINQLILGMQDINGEYVVRQDDEDIELNGIHKLVINNNPFAYTQDTRNQLIDDLWDKVKGFGYIPYELKGEWLPHLELGDTIKIDGIDTIVLRIEAESPKALNTIMSAPALIDSSIEYSDNTNDINNKLRRTEYKVDKAEGTITELTEVTKNVQDNLNNNYYNITQTNELIQNAEGGLTNTFSEAGGNNIFRNTGLWFMAEAGDNLVYPSEEIYPGEELYPGAYGNYEFWVGNADKERNDKAVCGNSILLKNDIFSQEQEVPNGNYSISFYYRKTNPLANASVKINDKEYILDSEEWKQFYTGEQDQDGNYIVQPIEVSTGHLRIDFMCSINGAVEVYDIMANKGSVKLAWSQNQNETTTETVNISKGITITSSDTESTFKANADGIRILDGNNNKTTWFTDKGTSTKELIVEKQANLCGVLVMEVDDQTWMTRM